MDVVFKKRKMDMPEELVFEILMRLPVKSLLKFRCVCKEWRDFIKSRRFINEHMNHPSQSHRINYLLLKRLGVSTRSTSLSFYGRCRDDTDDLDHKAAFDYVASDRHRWESMSTAVNGIFCFGYQNHDNCDPASFQYDSENYALYLCNPATRQVRRVPDRPFGVPFPRVRYRTTYIDKVYRCERHNFGFGIDPSTKEYKLVLLMFFRLLDSDTNFMGLHHIEVYHLSSNSWRLAEDRTAQEVMSYDQFTLSVGVYTNGYLHWIVASGYGNEFVIKLFRFDMRNEVMEKMECPVPSIDFTSTYAHLVVIKDSLAFLLHEVVDPVRLVEGAAANNEFRGKSQIVIWMMREYGEEDSWIKAFCLGPFNEQICDTTFYCWNNDMLVFQTVNGELASCNLIWGPDDGEPGQLRKHNVAGYVHPLAFSYGPFQVSSYYVNPNRCMEAIIIDKESLLPLR